MAITVADLERLLDEAKLRHQEMPAHDAVMVGFALEPECTYRDQEGEPHLLLALRLAEDGQFLSVFAAACWSMANAAGRHAIYETLIAIQSRFKLVRFDIAEDFITPNVEVSIEDGTLTSEQLQRIIGALLQAIRSFDRPIRTAIETGEMALDDIDDHGPGDSVSNPPADDDVRLLRLADEAGGRDERGVDALERLLGGDPGGDVVPPIGL